MTLSALLAHILRNISAISIVPTKRELVAVNQESSIKDVLRLLSTNGILSTPCLKQSGQDFLCAGSVDVFGISEYLMNESAQRQESNVVDEPVKNVIKGTSKEPLISFFSENPLSSLVDLFGTGHHRVLLFGSNRQLLRPCSQSDLIVFLTKLLDQANSTSLHQSSALEVAKLDFETSKKIVELASSPVENLKLGCVGPVSLHERSVLKDALRIMHEKNISSVAIVNSDGKLVGAFSAAELRGFEHLCDLDQNILAWIKGHSPSLQLLSFDSNVSFGQLLKGLRGHGKTNHRAWIVDHEGKPVRVISASDIFKFLSTGEIVNARQANADIDPSKLWAPNPETVREQSKMESAASESNRQQLNDLHIL